MATVAIVPDFPGTIAARPAALLATGAAGLGLGVAWWGRRSGRMALAFAGSGAFVAGIVAATAASAYPIMIRASDDPVHSLTALNAAAADSSLRAGLLWWPVGFVLEAVYTITVFRLNRTRVNVTR
jgi:cytochrome bd-type quinol oxidase subunit 2